MADNEQIRELVRSRAPLSTWLGIVLLFFLFGAIVLAVIGPSPRGSNYEQERARQRMEKVKPLQDDAKSLTTYGWIDKNKGTVRIPIQRAIELAVVDLANKKPALAGPIATPPPAAAAQAPAAPSPGASASPRASASPKPNSVAGPQSENRGQPAAATNPAPVQPGSQPGASATPAASAGAPSAKAPASPAPTPAQAPPGSPLPVRGKQTPSPSPGQ
ncbi:MAG: hypothetical protein QOG48_1637 [Verrucomicrobiota bacterium]